MRDRGETQAIFVYGTLKRGELNHGLVAPFARSISGAWTEGDLFDVGLFPAMVAGTGQVRGEVVRLDPADVEEVVTLLDLLEDCRPDDPAGSLYLRRIVEVVTDDGERERAYAYFYNREHGELPPVETLERVEGGEWGSPSTIEVRSDSSVLEVFGDHVRTFRYDVEQGK